LVKFEEKRKITTEVHGVLRERGRGKLKGLPLVDSPLFGVMCLMES